MSWIEKLDTFWKGLAIGILFPLLCFFCYWLFMHSYMAFPVKFIKYLMFGQMLSNTIKMCALGNLLIFYFFLNKGLNNATKGIITSVVIYAALVFYVMYFHEEAF
ncbi:MAG: hypothetical protein J0L69_05340 [Bacteroidetes bacterium]|nr:hypothetical protein [Bacteroidota bacterium]